MLCLYDECHYAVCRYAEYHDFTTQLVYYIFTILLKIFFAVCFNFKHYSFWPSADLKLTPNDLVYAMHWLCMFALYVYAILRPYF